jgi:hypothetical protein
MLAPLPVPSQPPPLLSSSPSFPLPSSLNPNSVSSSLLNLICLSPNTKKNAIPENTTDIRHTNFNASVKMPITSSFTGLGREPMKFFEAYPYVWPLVSRWRMWGSLILWAWCENWLLKMEDGIATPQMLPKLRMNAQLWRNRELVCFFWDS